MSIPFRLNLDQAQALAQEFGTPLYVVDEAHFRGRIREYRQALHAAEPNSALVFATKANSTLALLAIALQEGCLLDVASSGELHAALRAGARPDQCHLHGNNKLDEEIELALSLGIAEIVIDNFREIETIARLRPEACPTQFVLRLAPGVDPKTHRLISTGQADTKFGFGLHDGQAERALLRCLALGLPVLGFHCHVGSQLVDPEAQRAGGEALARFAIAMQTRHGFVTKVLNVGGGLGVRYTDADEPMPIEAYARLIAETVRAELAGSGMAPVLMQEPGRALVAESGVTLYRVGVIKDVHLSGGAQKTYASVDGGLSDNSRPAMYGARYTVLDFRESSTRSYTVAGRHCETDILFPNISLSETLQEGDLVQVLCTGAYNASMASNYNRFMRPASVMLRKDGRAELIQRRETLDEVFAREVLPADLRAPEESAR